MKTFLIRKICAICGLLLFSQVASAVTLKNQLDDQRRDYVGAPGEIVFALDTPETPLTIHDGSTIGGIRLVSVDGAVPRVSTITITNDAAWTGWLTTGELIDGNIKLDNGEWLESPRLTGGVSSYDLSGIAKSGNSSANIGLYTNSISDLTSPPYTGTDARLRIAALGGMSSPGDSTPNFVMVSNIVITSYSDPSLLAQDDWISQFNVVNKPREPTQMARLDTVSDAETRANSYADAAVATRAANYDKTLLATDLILGDGWSPTNTLAGARYPIIASGHHKPGTNYWALTHHYDPLLEFESVNGAIDPDSYSLDGTTVTVWLPTAGVVGAPFAEYSDDLTDAVYHRVSEYSQSSYPTVTNNQYLLQFDVPDDLTQVYLRILQPLEPTTARFNVAAVDLGSAPIVVHGSVNGTNRTAMLRYDFAANVWFTEVSDDE